MARRQPILTPGKSALLMLGLGTISLMGIPGFGTELPPAGAMAGVVLDEMGEPLQGVPVALFDGSGLHLIELASSDGQGRFAFQQAPWVHHVLVNPDPALGYLPRWELDRERSDSNVLELGLTTGHLQTIEVHGPGGSPLEGAEVRVIDSFENVVVTRLLTDEQGQIQVVLPANYHLGVLAASEGLAPVWKTNLEASQLDGEVLQIELSEGVWHYGDLSTPDGEPISGVVVSAWDDTDGEWNWLGYDLSRADGTFQVLGTDSTHLRALDPEQAVLPGSWDLDAIDGPLSLVLEFGDAVLVQVEGTDTGSGSRRVWVYDEVQKLWSWGVATDDAGMLAVQTAGNPTTILAEPIDGNGEVLTQTVTPEPGAPLVLRPDEQR